MRPVTAPPELTPELIRALLARMTPERLAAAAKERQRASLDPLKKESLETVSELGKLADQIDAIDPTWEPPKEPTTPEKIQAWVKAQGKPVSKSEIANGLGTKYIGNTVKKMVEKAKTLSFDKTAKTYSVAV
jgi:hypothetical protein